MLVWQGRFCASKVTGVWLKALCPLPSSTGSKIEDYLVWWDARTQFVDEYGFVGRGIIVLPQGGLIHWGCCLEMFYNLVPPWAINCVKNVDVGLGCSVCCGS